MKPSNERRFSYLLSLLLLAGLVGGVYWILSLRLQTGDVYPPYSSLRADPLGVKVLYEGLSSQGQLSVDRNYGPVEKLDHDSETVLFDLGEEAGEAAAAPDSLNQDWESFVSKGGRLVVTFLEENTDPQSKKNFLWEETPVPSPTVIPRRISTQAPELTLGEKWGFSLGFKAPPETTDKSITQERETFQPVTVLRNGDGKLPPTLLWHSGLYFEKLDPAWTAIYLRGSLPVAIERPMGKGQLVFFLDSYFVSNEAMLNDRHADLLAYFVGEKKRVVFDETHLGVKESPNTSTLIAKYGLGGLGAGLLVLAGLFTWHSSVGLVPPTERSPEKEASARSGKDFSAGLVSLLRRNIPSRDILAVCFESWKRTFVGDRKHLAAKAREMERELSGLRAGKNIHPVEGYLKLSAILKKKK